MIKELTPTDYMRDYANDPNTTLLDVRETWELQIAAVPKALHIPMGSIPDRLAELDRNHHIAVLCRSGGRSMQAASFLYSQGYPTVSNITGGILAWGRELDPSITAY